jgi:hypothetical protein
MQLGGESNLLRSDWGYQKLLDIEVVRLVPRQIDSFYHYSTVPSSNVTGLQLIRKGSRLKMKQEILRDAIEMHVAAHS